MQNPHTPTPEATQAINLLASALGSALDNLPDVADAGTAFGREATVACCADIAALSHLLAVDDAGMPNIAAYL